MKNLLISVVALAMLASSTRSVPAMGPGYGFGATSAEAQQFSDELQRQNDMANDPEAGLQAMQAADVESIPATVPQDFYLPLSAEAQQLMEELQQQNGMANDPDSAALQQAQQMSPAQRTAAANRFIPLPFCYHSLYILAFTSGLTNAQSDDRAYVEMRLRTGDTRLVRLYNRPGDDYMRYKGDLWKISLSSFGFSDKCITRSDIDNLALVEGGNDGWNIESVVTFLKRGSYYRLLSRDFNVYRWLDGNGQLSHLRFDLNLV